MAMDMQMISETPMEMTSIIDSWTKLSHAQESFWKKIFLPSQPPEETIVISNLHIPNLI